MIQTYNLVLVAQGWKTGWDGGQIIKCIKDDGKGWIEGDMMVANYASDKSFPEWQAQQLLTLSDQRPTEGDDSQLYDTRSGKIAQNVGNCIKEFNPAIQQVLASHPHLPNTLPISPSILQWYCKSKPDVIELEMEQKYFHDGIRTNGVDYEIIDDLAESPSNRKPKLDSNKCVIMVEQKEASTDWLNEEKIVNNALSVFKQEETKEIREPMSAEQFAKTQGTVDKYKLMESYAEYRLSLTKS